MTDAAVFKQEVERRFYHYFNASREGYKLPDMERHRLAGFIQAGVFLGLVSNAEMQDLMEQVHATVFGQSIAERRESRAVAWNVEAVDYSAYEQPAYLRVND